ncbi:hypothetical protein [Bradyrhizobium quebecense]|uniref:Uncharacterized protein n=1 Tax=Bradyrhizobium quebecense TaxID=2748629 RepID=A0ACD3VLR3_9BRAD|nr:hypothetical protein [Bradyrhizobium quebecense]UGY07454.1 hypothetical protein J4P68_0040485 [Bradyrhizobium quebecense]
MAQPLSKTKEDDGTPYTRPTAIEAAIDVALGQDLETLCRRAAIRNSKLPDYLPSECLVHLVRHALRTSDEKAFNALFTALLERCAANVNKKVDPSIPNAARVRRDIRREFAALFAIDGTPDDKHQLDFFEVRFNLGFMRLRQTHVTRALAELEQSVAIPDEAGESIERECDDEVLARIADLNRGTDLEHRVFRQQVFRAITALPEHERKAIILVHYYGFQIASDNPAKVTAATLCNVTGRTIQNWLTSGLATLSTLREQA